MKSVNLSNLFDNHSVAQLERVLQIQKWQKSPGISYLLDDLSRAVGNMKVEFYTYMEHYGPFVSLKLANVENMEDGRLVELLHAIHKHAPTKEECYDIPMRNSTVYEFRWVGPEQNGFAPLVTVALEAISK